MCAAVLRNVTMSDKRYDQISARIRQTYPNACMLWIDEIDNRNLEQEHEDLYQIILAKRPAGTVSRQELFHGTGEESIKAITQGGFKVSYNKIGAYGKGTYFSKNANYSINYARDGKEQISYMFLCSVIVGTCGSYGSLQPINTELHDNAVDNPIMPSMYITPHDYGGIPKYIIAFYKSAPQ